MGRSSLVIFQFLMENELRYDIKIKMISTFTRCERRTVVATLVGLPTRSWLAPRSTSSEVRSWRNCNKYFYKITLTSKNKKRNEALRVQPHKLMRMANQAKLASSETKGAAGFQRALSGTVLLGQRLNGRR